MPEKKATYRINESMLRNTLLGYSVEVDLNHCSTIEQEASAIRMQKSFVMPDAKVLVKYVVLPLLLIGGGILIYANIDSIQTAFTPVPEPVVKTEQKKVVPPPVVKTPTVAVVNNTPPPIENNVVAKRDTVIVANKSTDSAKKQVAKQPLPVVAGPPTDSATGGKSENLTKVNKVDTASQKSDAPVKKKKKKRRKRSDAYIEDVKETSLQPNSADDDVVVPQ